MTRRVIILSANAALRQRIADDFGAHGWAPWQESSGLELLREHAFTQSQWQETAAIIMHHWMEFSVVEVLRRRGYAGAVIFLVRGEVEGEKITHTQPCALLRPDAPVTEMLSKIAALSAFSRAA